MMPLILSGLYEMFFGSVWFEQSGLIGKTTLSIAFIATFSTLFTAYMASRGLSDKQRHTEAESLWGRLTIALWSVQGITLIFGSIILLQLLKNHQFQYFYVWNHTSLDLLPKYLLSAFYGGQEGSFMLWILLSTLIGFGLIRWTRAPYRWPVMFVMAFTQVFLLSMILGWKIGDIQIGASPFRTLIEEMPDAPFLQANPNFVPTDGRGLNDLLKSPWMMIHPPLLFVGFSMMTVPFAFAIASLWTRTYHEWVRPALPWTLTANVMLLTAIFLGGYWAYETLSFGGYWAWDPVENASLVPWLIGTAGIHTMIIQTRSSRAHKASLFFAIFAYILIVYETFLTRSGVLANASVHSFVDLGLYNQLLIFMLAITGIGIGFYLYRYRELPSPEKESTILSGEFLTFTGAIALLVLGLVIILGTSSPIIGRLFYPNPTPPEISFYNDWSTPIALIMGILTVVGQMVFWRKHTWESLAGKLIWPLLLTSGFSVATIILGNVRDLYDMLIYFISWFVVFGNGAVLISLLLKDPKLIGGTITHVGFGVLLLGILASSKYNSFLVPPVVENFNNRVKAGEAFDEEGFPITNMIESFELKRNEPKLLNQKYLVTYEGYERINEPRPGTQIYNIRFKSILSDEEFVLRPEVYPMNSTAGNGRVDWSVDPDIRTGWMSDIYLYVGGSALVDKQNERIAEGLGVESGDETTANEAVTDSVASVVLRPNEPLVVENYQFTFKEYAPAQQEEVPPGTQVGIRAVVDVLHQPTGKRYEVVPLFAVFIENGQSMTYSPPLRVDEWNLEVQFASVVPDDNGIQLNVTGLNSFIEEDWIFVTAEKKPFVSVVWMGTFILMAGFSMSTIRHWQRDREANRKAKEEEA